MQIAIQPQSLSYLIRRGFDETLMRLRSALREEELDIVCELPLHREFQKNMGVTCRKYTVLVVWSQFDTWRAVLTENDAGLLMPFNIAVVEDGESTRIAVANWNNRRQCRPTIGVSLMLDGAEVKLRRVFARCDREDHASGVHA
jgi:uncharacterized protein (DUF302 family)